MWSGYGGVDGLGEVWELVCWEGVWYVWDSIQRAVDVVKDRVGLVGVELAREWGRVGWM